LLIFLEKCVYKRQLSDSQGLDETSFDDEQTCVSILRKLLKCHGIDTVAVATNERVVVEGAAVYI
jgi:hypothetical protein